MKRQTFIGGSDVAAILGLSRYKTPYEVWDEKKNGNNPFSGNQFTEWGTKLEPVIIKHFEQVNNVTVLDNNVKFISADHNFLGCHPDGIFDYKGVHWLLEVKTVSSTAYKHWANELPLEYYCQVQHNMHVLELKQAKFACLVLDDRNYFEIDVNYDTEFVEKQLAYLVGWWQRFIVGDEIPLKMVEDYERDNPDIRQVEADEEAVKLHADILGVKDQIKTLTDKKEAIEDTLKLKIGDATDLMHGLNTIATWRPQTRVTVQTKKLKEEKPEIFLKYASEKTSRTFLVKTN